MQSRYDDREARKFVQRYAAHGEDLALRVYTSRLIGRDQDLVLHGGGNTSVKTTQKDALGAAVRCLCVKGSGADLVAVEPHGLPALELEPLLSLRALPSMTDDVMVNELRRRLLDVNAPNPSVETLLHAFLPQRFVDHTHADAILLLTNQPDGQALVREALGEQVAILPYIMPGFPLAKAVADAFERQPDCVGIVLLHHGIFTFGDTAKQSYERMIALVSAAERFATQRIGAVPAMLRSEPAPLRAAERQTALRELLPRLRHVLPMDARPSEARLRVVASVRCGDDMASFSAHPAARELCATGPITPDHVIRTKGRYLFLDRDAQRDPARLQDALLDYVCWYTSYFESAAHPLGRTVMLHPMPPVVVVEGCGVIGMAPLLRSAQIAADIAEHTLKVWAQGHALGRYVPLSPRELAEMEYWPLELAKLGKQKAPSLAGQVAVVTGAAGAIGCAVTGALLHQGACVVMTDRDHDRLQKARERHVAYDAQIRTVAADLAEPSAVTALFDAAVLAFGGVDTVAVCHGIASVARLVDLAPERFEQLLSANVTSTLHVLAESARVLKAQGTGGNIVLQVSKNAFAPGAGFGGYSASKAAALQLGRIAALEYAEFGVRVNMINADAVFGDGEVPSQLWAEIGPDRMKARGLDADGLRAFYRDRSLLKRTVTPQDVADAVIWLASNAHATTGAVIPVDSGIAEAFPR
jgi:rhamnose utilization protein RhaD (predicted bifunctional aldolase and dehydrogenase)/NAD(P)-dependent dehydrogenase (short-subunit alcohol dehydrogenase family)